MNHFICANCNKQVSLIAPGTKNRNHCPYCLYSLHVDITPGDRKNPCMGLMQPVKLTTKPDGEEVLTHKCLKCGFERWNRVAGDDANFVKGKEE
jgi:DNA-directed RNA polymerase subunit RPC12/RpoP